MPIHANEYSYGNCFYLTTKYLIMSKIATLGEITLHHIEHRINLLPCIRRNTMIQPINIFWHIFLNIALIDRCYYIITYCFCSHNINIAD